MKKILIICAGLCLGGVERFAANISLFAPKGEFEFHYLVFEGSETDFEAECIENGAKILRVKSPSLNHTAYIKALKKILLLNHYDVVHSHTQFNSGINMWAAKRCGVPVRISHSHTIAHEQKIPLKKQLYEDFMRSLIKRYATVFLACGKEAGEWMYGTGSSKRRSPGFTVIHNGIDTGRFLFSPENRRRIRAEYQLSEDDFLIGHAGTLSSVKNQEFLIHLLPEIRKRKPTAKLMLIGRGAEEVQAQLQSAAIACGVSDQVLFTGPVMNVHEVLSALDVFTLPSRREGTPLALLEAQANGLPCVISDVVPDDAVVTDLVRSLPLEDTAAWIEAITASERSDPEKYADIVDRAGFGRLTAMEPLYEIYRR